ncbi:MAG: Uma2 family endonuclease [Terriglobales bacterium]
MASKAIAGAEMTLEEYLALGEDPPMTRLELSEGRLIVAPSSNAVHNLVRADLEQRLRDWVRLHRAGIVISETDVRLGEATVRRPDVCFFGKGRLQGRDPEALPLPAPDLVFEILSPHDRRRDLELKVRQYLAAGVQAVWLLDPRRVAATRHSPDHEPEQRSAIAEPNLLPGLHLELEAIFSAARRGWD